MDKYLLKVHKETHLLSVFFFSTKLPSTLFVSRLVSCQSLSLRHFARVK